MSFQGQNIILLYLFYYGFSWQLPISKAVMWCAIQCL